MDRKKKINQFINDYIVVNIQTQPVKSWVAQNFTWPGDLFSYQIRFTVAHTHNKVVLFVKSTMQAFYVDLGEERWVFHRSQNMPKDGYASVLA